MMAQVDCEPIWPGNDWCLLDPLKLKDLGDGMCLAPTKVTSCVEAMFNVVEHENSDHLHLLLC